jgi:hypothetical protein
MGIKFTLGRDNSSEFPQYNKSLADPLSAANAVLIKTNKKENADLDLLDISTLMTIHYKLLFGLFLALP